MNMTLNLKENAFKKMLIENWLNSNKLVTPNLPTTETMTEDETD